LQSKSARPKSAGPGPRARSQAPKAAWIAAQCRTNRKKTRNLHNDVPPPAPWKKKRTGLLFFLIGLPLGYIALTGAVDKLTSASWPAAHAVVVSADARKRVKSGAWCIQLRYQYVTGNQAFESSRWSLANSAACYRDKQVADALLKRYPVGAGFRIRYDPSDPDKSIVHVDDDLNFMDVIFCLLAIVLLAAGIQSFKGGATGAGRKCQEP
jgi:hypothetical protein